MKKTIRYRHRCGYAKEAQGYASWTEYQVVENRKVIGRYDFLYQAMRAHPDALPDKTATQYDDCGH
jgi:hypothetical protein